MTFDRSESRPTGAMPRADQDFQPLPKLLTSFATGAAAFFALIAMARMSHAESRIPNVVVLLADDLGWKDIGCYGGPVRTPNLDRLASEGMRLTDFYSGAAVCSPSRAVLLTGRTNLRCSIYSWINDHDQRIHLPTSEVTLAELLKAEGFATAHFGKWHLGMPSTQHPDKPTPSDHGFDDWFATPNNAQPSHRNPTNFIHNGILVGPRKGYACDLVVDDAVGWLDARSNKEAPFFLNVWFHEPHAPLAAPSGLVQQYGDSLDSAALYSATIANTDRAIGRLIEKLHKVDAPENTIIIYASDNGSYRSDRVGNLRGTKGSNYEGGIRVPGIFYWPGHIPAASVTDQPAGLVDIVPTVCGLLGIVQTSTRLDGTDLSDLLTGKTTKVVREQPLFWGLPLAGPAFAIRAGRYAMVAYRDGEVPRDNEAIAVIKTKIESTLRDKGVFGTETRGSTFAKQLFEGFSDSDAERLRGQFIRLNQFHESWIPTIKQSKLTRFELYDLVADPSQQRDLSIQMPQVHHRLKLKLERLASDAMREAFDWSSSQAAPVEPMEAGEGKQAEPHVHRLQFTSRSPFDAFLYVNRIPAEREADETPDDLAGRILGRLANQEGRILVKLPPGMNRLAYEGFKIALESGNDLHRGRCFACHRLPELGHATASPPIPSLRNASFSRDQLREVMASDSHREIRIDNTDFHRLHFLLQSLSDVPEESFRELILNATVLDTSGEPQ